MGRVGRRQLHRLDVSPYQRGVLERGIYLERADPRSADQIDPSLQAGMMYTGAIGVMVMEQMLMVVEGFEAMVHLTRQGVERKWKSDRDERADLDQKISALEEREERDCDLSRSNRVRITELENVVDQLQTRVRQLTNQVTALREGMMAIHHPIGNPIVIDDDDVGPSLVEAENGVPPGQLIEIEDTDDEEEDDEEEDMADDDEARDGEAIGEALQVRIAAADPAPEYLPPPDYD